MKTNFNSFSAWFRDFARLCLQYGAAGLSTIPAAVIGFGLSQLGLNQTVSFVMAVGLGVISGWFTFRFVEKRRFFTQRQLSGRPAIQALMAGWRSGHSRVLFREFAEDDPVLQNRQRTAEHEAEIWATNLLSGAKFSGSEWVFIGSLIVLSVIAISAAPKQKTDTVKVISSDCYTDGLTGALSIQFQDANA